MRLQAVQLKGLISTRLQSLTWLVVVALYISARLDDQPVGRVTSRIRLSLVFIGFVATNRSDKPVVHAMTNQIAYSSSSRSSSPLMILLLFGPVSTESSR